ncbi:MAG: hypothetical protein ABTQ31_14165 [Rhizobiaceae bacterium]
MRKLILASAWAIAVLGLAACSDTDSTTTRSIESPDASQQQQSTPTTPQPAQAVPPAPQTGTGGDIPGSDPGNRVIEPTSPAPAQ